MNDGVALNRRNLGYCGSVARFGEISPLWQNFTSLWPFLRLHLIFCKNFCKFLCAFGQFFTFVIGQRFKIIYASGHTGYLTASKRPARPSSLFSVLFIQNNSIFLTTFILMQQNSLSRKQISQSTN